MSDLIGTLVSQVSVVMAQGFGAFLSVSYRIRAPLFQIPPTARIRCTRRPKLDDQMLELFTMTGSSPQSCISCTCAFLSFTGPYLNDHVLRSNEAIPKGSCPCVHHRKSA